MRRALLVLLLVLPACGVPLDEQPRALDPSQAPFGVLEMPSSAPEGDGRVALYFIRDDRVVLQPRAVQESTDIKALLDLLLAGPTPEQVAAGTRSAIPTSLQVRDIEVGPRGVAVVTLGGEDPQVGTSPLSFAQIVATLTAPGRADAVRFRFDGEDLQVPRGDGSLTDAPLDRDDYAQVLLLQSGAPTTSPTASAAPSPSAS